MTSEMRLPGVLCNSTYSVFVVADYSTVYVDCGG